MYFCNYQYLSPKKQSYKFFLKALHYLCWLIKFSTQPRQRNLMTLIAVTKVERFFLKSSVRKRFFITICFSIFRTYIENWQIFYLPVIETTGNFMSREFRKINFSDKSGNNWHSLRIYILRTSVPMIYLFSLFFATSASLYVLCL